VLNILGPSIGVIQLLMSTVMPYHVLKQRQTAKIPALPQRICYKVKYCRTV